MSQTGTVEILLMKMMKRIEKTVKLRLKRKRGWWWWRMSKMNVTKLFSDVIAF